MRQADEQAGAITSTPHLCTTPAAQWAAGQILLLLPPLQQSEALGQEIEGRRQACQVRLCVAYGLGAAMALGLAGLVGRVQ